MDEVKNKTEVSVVQELARMAATLQQQRTGVAPKAVTAVLSEDTLVVTLHDALTPAERASALTPEGAARVQEFHRQLFASSSDAVKLEMMRIAANIQTRPSTRPKNVTGALSP